MSFFSKIKKGLKKALPIVAQIGVAYMTGGASLALQAAAKRYMPAGGAGEELVEAASTAASSGGSFTGAIKDYGAKRLYDKYADVQSDFRTARTSLIAQYLPAARQTTQYEEDDGDEEDYDEEDDDEPY